MIQNPHSQSSWESLWGQFSAHCFSFDSFRLKPPGTGMLNCAFKSCHTAPAMASGVVTAAAAAITGITFAAKPAGEEVLAKIWRTDVRKGFWTFFFPSLAGSSLCQYRHFETTDKNPENVEGESGNKVKAKKKKKKNPQQAKVQHKHQF